MAKKDGMYLYNDWLAPFEKLEKSEVGELVIAMMRYYTIGEEPPKYDGLLGMAADFIFPQLDRSMEYARLGQKGGIASKCQRQKGEHYPSRQEEKTEREEEKVSPLPDETLSAEREDETDGQAETLSTVYKEEERDGKAAEAEYSYFSDEGIYNRMRLESSFDKFWLKYPKKIRKDKAFEAFKRLSPKNELFSQMLSALERQKSSALWNKEDGRFVPLPENWLEDRRWEDKIELVQAEACKSFDTDEFFRASLENTMRCMNKEGSDQLSNVEKTYKNGP